MRRIIINFIFGIVEGMLLFALFGFLLNKQIIESIGFFAGLLMVFLWHLEQLAGGEREIHLKRKFIKAGALK